MKNNRTVDQIVYDLVVYVDKKWAWAENADFDPYYEIYRAYIAHGEENPKFYYRTLYHRYLDSLRHIHESIPEEYDCEQEESSAFDLESTIAPLTLRQKMIVDLALDGLSQKEIATELGLSAITVKREYKLIKETLRPILY